MPTMTGGSDDARASDDGRNSVDAGWDELIGESEKDDEDSGQPDARPVSGSHAAAPRSDPDDEMARLMAGEAPKLPTLDPESTKIIVQEAASAEPPTVVTPAKPTATEEPKVVVRAQPTAAASSKPDVARAQPTAAASSKPDVARAQPAAAPSSKPDVVRAQPAAAPSSKPDVVREEPADKARASKPSLRVLDHPAAPAQARATQDRAARASRPVETPAPAVVEPAAPRGLPWAWIGLGVVAVGVVAYVATREPKPTGSGREPVAVAPVPERSPREPVRAAAADSSEPMGTEASGSDTASDTGTTDAGDTNEPKPPTSRKGDPREPPPGTPPEIAAVFRRLPVGPADRPPVGGIGATGIHVDHIAMGTETQGGTCRGRTDHFSVDGGDRAGVCVRVVHSREKEELQVLWQKHGGSTRRSKMVVLPMHAYRTRGYLVLRKEYIGDWTVRILSSDGVELARHDFTVDP
jgi:hypothetical protein